MYVCIKQLYKTGTRTQSHRHTTPTHVLIPRNECYNIKISERLEMHMCVLKCYIIFLKTLYVDLVKFVNNLMYLNILQFR